MSPQPLLILFCVLFRNFIFTSSFVHPRPSPHSIASFSPWFRDMVIDSTFPGSFSFLQIPFGQSHLWRIVFWEHPWPTHQSRNQHPSHTSFCPCILAWTKNREESSPGEISTNSHRKTHIQTFDTPGYPYGADAIFDNGGYEGWLIGETAGVVNYWIPECMDSPCPLSPDFVSAFPDIAATVGAP